MLGSNKGARPDAEQEAAAATHDAVHWAGSSCRLLDDCKAHTSNSLATGPEATRHSPRCRASARGRASARPLSPSAVPSAVPSALRGESATRVDSAPKPRGKAATTDPATAASDSHMPSLGLAVLDDEAVQGSRHTGGKPCICICIVLNPLNPSPTHTEQGRLHAPPLDSL